MDKERIGKLIETPDELLALAWDKKSVYQSGTNSVIPASVIIHWQFVDVMRCLVKQLLYVYIPKEKKQFHEKLKHYPLIPNECFTKDEITKVDFENE